MIEVPTSCFFPPSIYRSRFWIRRRTDPYIARHHALICGTSDLICVVDLLRNYAQISFKVNTQYSVLMFKWTAGIISQLKSLHSKLDTRTINTMFMKLRNYPS